MKTDRQPNWLLRSLVLFSIAVHGVIGWQMLQHYRSTQVTYLELSLADVFKPSTRNIPRPRIFPKPPQKLKNLPKPTTPTVPLPRRLPRPVAAPTPQKAPLNADLLPSADAPMLPDSGIAAWHPPVVAPKVDDQAATLRYMAVVLKLIEKNKRYPSRAKRFSIQGKVQVAFTITPEGTVEEVTITKGAKSEDLNREAVAAIKRAAPFPRPPLEFFSGTRRVAVTIRFELS